MSELEIYELDLDWDFVNHLADPESFAIIKSEGISEELIVDEYVKEVYRWQKSHARREGKPATPSALEATFDEVTIDKPLTSVGDLLQRLRDRYVKNQGRKKIQGLGEAYKEDPLSLVKEMQKAARELSKLTVGKGDSWGLGDHDRAMAEYNKLVLRGPGPSFGFKEIDDFFGGQRGLTFYLGAPKSMKTWMGINCIDSNVLAGRNYWGAMLEVEAEEANMRYKCLTANVPWWKYMKGKLDKKDRMAMAEAEALRTELGSYRIWSPPPGQRRVDQIVEAAIDGGADGLVIDQLQYLQDGNGVRLGDGNNTGSYWGVGDDLRAYSKEIPILVIHQFNRSVMNADSMPEMQQAKGSSMVEEVATLVMGMRANKDMRDSGILELGTLASRNFGLASWEVGVEMVRGCRFEINGLWGDDDE